MIASLLASAAPLALAGIGGLLSETAGSLAVFLEGFMTIGSFAAWTATRASGSAAAGCAAAVLVAGSAGYLLARFVKASGANPFIVALALNLAAGGAADALSVVWFGTKGVLSDPSFPNVGSAPFAAMAAAAVAAAAFVLKRTRLGLRLRATGREPNALRERGVDPDAYRAGAWAAAAALAALAGAALTFRVGAYAPGGVAGRGWIALVIVYLGFRKPFGVGAAALAFAAAEYAADIAQGTGTVPATVLLGLPSALALVLFVFSTALRKGAPRKAAVRKN